MGTKEERSALAKDQAEVIYIYVYIYTYIHTYIHTYILTHTHTNTNTQTHHTHTHTQVAAAAAAKGAALSVARGGNTHKDGAQKKTKKVNRYSYAHSCKILCKILCIISINI